MLIFAFEGEMESSMQRDKAWLGDARKTWK